VNLLVAPTQELCERLAPVADLGFFLGRKFSERFAQPLDVKEWIVAEATAAARLRTKNGRRFAR